MPREQKKKVKTTFLHKVTKYASHEVKFPLALALVLETISHFQVMSTVIKAAFSDPEGSHNIAGPIKAVLMGSGVFSLWNILDHHTLPMVLWGFCIAYLLVQLAIFLTIVIMTWYKTKRYWLFEIFTIISTLHSRILFYPFQFFFFQIIDSMLGQKTTSTDLPLIRSNPIGYVTIIFTILNILLAAFKELFLYQINKSKDPYTRKNNTLFLVMFLQKVLTAAVYVLAMEGKVVNEAITIITIIYCIFALSSLRRKLPFYNIIMLQFANAMVTATLAISLIGIYSAADPENTVSDILLVVCILIAVKISLVHMNQVFDQILIGELNSPEIAIHFPILFKKYTKRYAGLLIVRDEFPEETLYFYNSFDPALDENANSKDPKIQRQTKLQYYTKIVHKLLSIKHNPLKSQVFLLYLARLYMKKLDNASKALLLLEKARRLDGSIPVKNSIEILRYSLQQSYLKALGYTHEELELANYFLYREDFIYLKSSMEKEITHHLDFWSEMVLDTVQVRKTVELSNSIDEIYLQIRERWRKKNQKFSALYPSSMLMYGLYLDSIRGLPQESMPIIQRFYNHNKGNDYKNKMGTLNDQVAIVIASLEKDKLGVVIDASNTVESLFGIPKEKLIGDNMSILMPEFLMRHLNDFLKQYIKNTDTKRQKTIYSYGKNLNGEVFQMEMELRLYPYLDKGVSLMANLRRKDQDEQFFILKPDGMIAGSSEKMQETWEQFKLNFKTSNPLKSFDELERINQAFNMVYYAQEDAKQTMAINSEMSFAKDRFNTDEFFATKENNLTNGFETNTERLVKNTLKTKIEDTYAGFQADEGIKTTEGNYMPQKTTLTQTMKQRKYTGSSSAKSKIQLNEEEAKEICRVYERGSCIKHLFYGENNEGKKTDLVIDLRIEPFVVLGEIYKICRVMEMQVQEHREKRTMTQNSQHYMLVASPTMYPHQMSEFNQVEARAVDSFQLSKKSDGSSDVDIPEERNEIQYKKPNGKNKTFAKMQTQFHEDSTTNDIKKGESFVLAHTKEEMRVDVRNSITGKSSTTHSRMDLKLIKTLNDFFGERKVRLMTRLSIYGVYLIMLGIFVLAFVNYFFNKKALTEISNGVIITTTASERLTTTLRTWQWILLIYSRVVGLRVFHPVLSKVIKAGAVRESQNMEMVNNLLRSNLNEFGSTEIIDIIYSTKVTFWDPSTFTIITRGPIDSFTANTLLAMNSLTVGNWSKGDAGLLTKSEPMTAINNTANDYLISSETQIEQILEGLDGIITKNEESLLVILFAENMALLVLCFSLLFVARVVVRTFSRTFQALVRLTPESVEERVYRIKKFQSVLAENIEAQSFMNNLNLYMSFFDEKLEKKQVTKKKGNEKRLRLFAKNFTNRGLLFEIGKFLGVSFSFIAVIAGLFFILYFESINSFTKLSGMNAQIAVSSKLSYMSCLVVGSFYVTALTLVKDGLQIRQEAPDIQLDKNLDAFKNVNQELLSTLFSSEEGFDPTMQEFLQSNICQFLNQTTLDECLNSTQQGSLGLLGFNLKFSTTTTNYVNQYKADQSFANVKQICMNYFNDITADLNIMDQAYTFLTDYISGIFDSEVNNLEGVNLLLSLASVFFVILATVMIQMITIKRLIFIDNSQKKLFRVLTYNVFSQNKSVGSMLKREFGSEVEGLNRLLNV